MTTDKIADRARDRLDVLEDEHVAATLDLSHFATRQSARESCDSFLRGHDAVASSKDERRDAWYDTPRGQRVERAERALLNQLLAAFPGAESALEIGCGTGRFSGWLTPAFRVLGIDRSPAMLAEMRARHPRIHAILGDAHWLPLPDGAIDVVLFVTPLEFLEDPLGALTEAVRVARRGVILLALNRWSVGGLSRRVGAQARSALLGQARDVSLLSLRAMAVQAAGVRLVALGEHPLPRRALGDPRAAPSRRCPRHGGGLGRAEA